MIDCRSTRRWFAVNQSAREPGFSDRIVISRQSQRHLEVNLTLGSLTDVAADAYVLGIFKNVGLGGAAVAVTIYSTAAFHKRSAGGCSTVTWVKSRFFRKDGMP